MYKIICCFFIIISRQGGAKGPNSYLNPKGLSNVYAMKDGTVSMLYSSVQYEKQETILLYYQTSFLKLEENAWQMQTGCKVKDIRLGTAWHRPTQTVADLSSLSNIPSKQILHHKRAWHLMLIITQ